MSAMTYRFARDRALWVGGSVAVFVAARAYAPHVHDGPTLCVFRGLTGLPCPGCGLTRAFCALATGDVTAALSWNACAIPLALLLAAAAAIAAGELVRGARWDFYRRIQHPAKLAYVTAGAVALYHVARCAYWAHEGTLFTKFAAVTSATWPSVAG